MLEPIYNYAIVPTCDRPDVAMRCVEALIPQVDSLLIIDNGPEERKQFPYLVGDHSCEVRCINRDVEGTPNLSRIWNLGLRWAADDAYYHERKQWNVAVLNDDAIVPVGWFETVAAKMRDMGAVAGCAGPVQMPILHTRPGPVPLNTRLVGYAFILAGEAEVRADEAFPWYYSDDHVDWLSREAGGMVMVPCTPVTHLYPDQRVTPELQEANALGARNFLARWGQMPW